ncbi:MAG: sugar ABC transporter permease, partial [Lachnospiraceae bacterium]|nr:sugar ABC transporter permease [Lachnospiraceae bacterium]
MTKKRNKHRLTRRKQRVGWLFVLPFVIGFLLFFLEPLVVSLWYSLNDVTMGQNGLETKWTGFGNFNYLLFQDSAFLRNLWTVTLEILKQVVICTSLSLFVAYILVQPFHGRTVYRAIFFMPIIMTSGVVYSMVSTVVGSSGLSGSANAYVNSGFSLTNLMTQGGVSPEVIRVLSSIVDSIFAMVTNCGVPILLYISGLQKIPSSAYEAARIEGANGWDIFWKITIPKISPIIFLNVV